jgi:hypothetical protein
MMGTIWQIMGNIRGGNYDSKWSQLPEIPQEDTKV